MSDSARHDKLAQCLRFGGDGEPGELSRAIDALLTCSSVRTDAPRLVGAIGRAGVDTGEPGV